MTRNDIAEVIKSALFPKDHCVSCEGEFQFNEQIYRDYDNKGYCKVCYKEKYRNLI